MKEYIISNDGAGCRLDKQLLKILKNCSNGFIYKMLRKKNITLNGLKAAGSEHLKNGDIIRIYFSDDTFDRLSGITEHREISGDLGFDPSSLIIFENSDIMILNKPPGLLSQKAVSSDISLNEICLKYLKDKGELTDERLAMFKPSICNRLDRNTSGLVIFAKTYISACAVSSMFKDRGIHKFYKCPVKGMIMQEERIEGYLKKDRASNKVSINEEPSVGANQIVTEYRPISYGNDITLLEVRLITGKSHQIRAHLSSIGHPVIGDHKYGDPEINDIVRKQFGIKHQMLHAYRLVMPDKLPGALHGLEGMIFEAPLPDKFERLLNEFKLTKENLRDA